MKVLLAILLPLCIQALWRTDFRRDIPGNELQHDHAPRVSFLIIADDDEMMVPTGPTALSAIAILSGNVSGTIRFSQASRDARLMIQVHLSGLFPGSHPMHVYEFGDLSLGCGSTGCKY